MCISTEAQRRATRSGAVQPGWIAGRTPRDLVHRLLGIDPLEGGGLQEGERTPRLFCVRLIPLAVAIFQAIQRMYAEPTYLRTACTSGTESNTP